MVIRREQPCAGGFEFVQKLDCVMFQFAASRHDPWRAISPGAGGMSGRFDNLRLTVAPEGVAWFTSCPWGRGPWDAGHGQQYSIGWHALSADPFFGIGKSIGI